MGRYINSGTDGTALPSLGKADYLALKENAMVVAAPRTEADFVENLVCVVDNGLFEAAAHCYSKAEMMAFARPDGRFKTWLVVPSAKQIAR